MGSSQVDCLCYILVLLFFSDISITSIEYLL